MKGVFLFKSQVFNSQIHPRMLSQCVHAWCASRFQGIHSQSSGIDLIVSLDIVFNAIPAVNSLLRYTFIKKLYKNSCVKNIRCFHFLFYLSSNVVIIFRTKKLFCTNAYEKDDNSDQTIGDESVRIALVCEDDNRSKLLSNHYWYTCMLC